MQRFETKYDLLNAAYKDESVKKGAILLLQYLVHKSNKEQCFPAVETIARALSVCKRTVQYNMRKLESAGYIIRKDRWYNHQQLTNQYVFNLGVIEDNTGYQYSDEEYLTIQDCLASNTKELDTKFIQEQHMNKCAEILKIYDMLISGREKLLLIYLCHKANQKGMTYNTINAMAQAIGVTDKTLIRLLNILRNKGLVKAKTIFVSGKEMILVKLTGNEYTKPKKNTLDTLLHNIQEKMENGQNAQPSECDRAQKIDYCGQNTQIHNQEHTTEASVPCMSWKQIWKKCKDAIHIGLHKIRRILRL